ncbi:MAG: baseplate J/gp47 family protein [Treponema sp.]|jgi:hypothetical protein|nr:baseplate J/gp47 family protein [Treponema sp.]
MEVKPFKEIYNDMRNYVIAHQDKLTDFNDGGVLVSQIEAFARELLTLYINCRVGFSSFLRGLPYSVFGFAMKEGEKASVDVIFSRSRPFSNDTTIPAGTIISAGGLNYMTAVAGTVESGALNSDPIPASAEKVGDKYNTPAGTIKTIVSVLPADIVTVNNAATATGGENAEDWAAYTDRFADYILGLQRTNTAGIKTGLSDLIRSMEIEEHFPPLDELWDMTFYLEDGSGGMTPEDLAEAKKIIDGNIAKGIGSFRAPGVSVRYKTPEIVPMTLNITVSTERDIANEVDQSVISNLVKDEVRRFINGLKIGKPLLISDLIVVLKRLPCLSNVQIAEGDFNILFNQIARYLECHVTVVT